ncbi:MAG: GAP family protein [Solirubrobacterales bacterium]|nr:GAP family protein [Solirubrobacterales bacterium]
MGEAIGQVIPFAVGVAISPIGIVAVTVMLSTTHGGRNGFAFLLGWFLGLVAFGALLLVLGSSTDASSGGEPSVWTGYARIIFGLLLLWVAYRQRAEDSSGKDSTPAWMDRVDSFNPVRSIGLGIGLGAVNPKNLVLTLGAAAGIAQTGAPAGDQAVALAVYAVIASIGTSVPVGIYYFMVDRAEGLLTRLRETMARNNGVIMAVICVVIAAKLIGDGIGILAA